MMDQKIKITKKNTMQINNDDDLNVNPQNNKEKLQELAKSNEEIIDQMDWNPFWNKELLNPTYNIPICDYYGSAFNESHHIQTELLIVKQREDWQCSTIIEFITKSNKAAYLKLPRYLRKLIVTKRFTIDKNNILCWKQQIGSNTINYLRVIPASLRASIAQYAHSAVHHGTHKMIQIIQQNMQCWWPKMRKYIGAWCGACNTCQRCKHGSFKTYGKSREMKLFSTTKVFEQISIDIVGP